MIRKFAIRHIIDHTNIPIILLYSLLWGGVYATKHKPLT
jgi:hypothetical protein